MYSDWSVLVGLTMAVIFIWLGVLSFLVLKQNNFLKSLFPKSGERDIRKKFREVLNEVSDINSNLGLVKDKLSQIERLDMDHIQKVEFLRYNPYDDTGGDQSFTICLLDGKKTGVIITSLHARSGTRVFAKPVYEGKAGKFQFSKEEEEVIQKAIK